MIRIVLALFLIGGLTGLYLSQTDQQSFTRYDVALKYLKSNVDLYSITAVSDTTCIPVPYFPNQASSNALAVYPKVAYVDVNIAASYGRIRAKACQEKGIPLMTLTNQGAQYAFDSEQPFDIDYDIEEFYPEVSDFSTTWHQEWQKQFGSSPQEVRNADWLVYFSPQYGDTLLASVFPHWDSGGNWSYHFNFTFSDKDSLRFVGVVETHNSITPIPLKGWPE